MASAISICLNFVMLVMGKENAISCRSSGLLRQEAVDHRR